MSRRALLGAGVAAALAAVPAFVVRMHLGWAAWMRAHGLPLPARTPWGWLRVWAREVAAIAHLVAWHVTLPAAHRVRTPARVQGAPVLCVHGYGQDASNFHGLRRMLHARGRPTAAVTLAVGPAEFAAYVRALDRALRRLLADTGADRVDVVCHSMGGLVLRAALDRAPDLRARIGRVVTLGTPHRGTGAARGRALWLPEPRVMAAGSAWTQATPRLRALLPGRPVTAIGSVDDTTVYPVDAALDDGDAQVRLEGTGHAGLLVAWSSLGHVLAALDRPAAP